MGYNKHDFAKRQVKRLARLAANKVVWVEDLPPVLGFKNSQYIELLLPFLEHPNKWGRFRTLPGAKYGSLSHSAKRMNAGYGTLPEGKWEFAARYLDETRQEAGLFARYLGPGEMPKPPVKGESDVPPNAKGGQRDSDLRPRKKR